MVPNPLNEPRGAKGFTNTMASWKAPKNSTKINAMETNRPVLSGDLKYLLNTQKKKIDVAIKVTKRKNAPEKGTAWL